MKNLFYVFLGLMVMMTSSFSYADDGLMMKNFWSKAPIGMMKMSAAYGSINNISDKEVIISSVTSPNVGFIELHTHSLGDDGIARMRKVEEVIIPAGEELTFKPGGYHFMLFDVTDEWLAGSEQELMVETKDGQSIKVNVMVKDPLEPNPNHTHH